MVRHPYSTTINKTGLMFNISFLIVSAVDMVARRGQHVTMKEIFPNNRYQNKMEALLAGRAWCAALLACALLTGCQTGAEAPAAGSSSTAENAEMPSNGAPTYAADVAPILNQKCVSCHGRFLPQKGLRLHTREAIFKGGDNGMVVVAGSPQGSPLYTALKLPPMDPRHMPPVAGGQTLSAVEIATIREWIAGGAL